MSTALHLNSTYDLTRFPASFFLILDLTNKIIKIIVKLHSFAIANKVSQVNLISHSSVELNQYITRNTTKGMSL